MDVIILSTTELGDRSYLIHDGSVAFVVDPQRDISRVLDAASKADVKIGAVAETHIHNDYVTGGYELATLLGVPYLVNEADKVNFERTAVSDGFEMKIGDLNIKVLATPGHTLTHVAYAVVDSTGDGAIFTGGSLLYGSVGRPDLLGPENTDFLARSQHRSARKIAASLPGKYEVQPTHGFGSFCSSSSCQTGTSSTIDNEQKSNFVFLIDDETKFKEALLGGLDVWPAYYSHMGAANSSGPKAFYDTLPRMISKGKLLAHLDKGSFIVDLRPGPQFANGHVPNSFALPIGNSFSTYLGWIYQWNTDIVLLAPSSEDAIEATRQLARIGIDTVVGYYPISESVELDFIPSSFKMTTFAELATKSNDEHVAVLDVRRNDERRASSIANSKHVPIHELIQRLPEMKEFEHREIWVHCAGGYRSTLAASILSNAGYNVVCINDGYNETFEGTKLLTAIA